MYMVTFDWSAVEITCPKSIGFTIVFEGQVIPAPSINDLWDEVAKRWRKTGRDIREEWERIKNSF
jgi:hypothetical protein